MSSTFCQLKPTTNSSPQELAGLDAEPLCPVTQRQAGIVRIVPVVLRAVLVHAENAEAVRVAVDENVDTRGRPLVRDEAQELQRREVGVALALRSAG